MFLFYLECFSDLSLPRVFGMVQDGDLRPFDFVWLLIVAVKHMFSHSRLLWVDQSNSVSVLFAAYVECRVSAVALTDAEARNTRPSWSFSHRLFSPRSSVISYWRSSKQMKKHKNSSQGRRSLSLRICLGLRSQVTAKSRSHGSWPFYRVGSLRLRVCQSH